MPKILLTTTALVALGGVSAASAVDISGFQRFEYNSWDDSPAETDGTNDTRFVDYNRVVFTHSVTGDNGLEASGYYRINDWAEAYHGVGVQTDLGHFGFGNWWTAGGFMYNSHLYNGTFRSGTGQTFTGTSTSAAAQMVDGGDNSITYTSPTIAGGIDAMITRSDAGITSAADVTEVFVAYSGGAGDATFRIHGGVVEGADSTGSAGDEQENTEYGLNVDSGAFGFRMTRAEEITKAASTSVSTAKVETNEYAVTYAMSDDMTLGLIQLDSNDKLATGTPKLDMTVIAANYFIMPGLRVQASSVNFDYETGGVVNDGAAMNVALRIDF